jgi:hypothetical protein
MSLKIKRLLSVTKLGKSIRDRDFRMHDPANQIRQPIRCAKLSLLPLLLWMTDCGNPELAQAKTREYTTTGSKTTTKFQIYYGPEATVNQMIGMELAANVWAEFLGDDVTINLFATTTENLPKNVLGGSIAEMLKRQISYKDFLLKWSADRKSQNDTTASKNFQKIGDDDDSGLKVMVNNQVVSDIENVNLTRANAKALGILSSKDPGFDGHIVLAQNLNHLTTEPNKPLKWNYNYTNNKIPSDTLDFLTTGVHEIGHMLGFTSGVDNPNLRTAIKNNQVTDSVVEKSITPLDLYRFSSKSTEQVISGDDDSASTKGIPDLSIGGNAFFSYNRGISKVEDMATGEDISLGGDGNQASHWKEGSDGMMEPYLETSSREVITHKDLIALDLIGWDVLLAAKGLDQLEAILPDLYNQAKATTQYKIANASTWILSDPPPLVNPVTMDGSNTIGDGDDNEDGTSVSVPVQDSSQESYCNQPESYYKSECLIWRSPAFQQYWNTYYQQLGLLNQQWQQNSRTTADTKSVPEQSATTGLLVLGGLLAMGLRRRISSIREESSAIVD